MNKIKVGHFQADGGLINLPIGYIPDVFDMDEVGTSNPDHVRWYRAQEAAEAAGSKEGMITNGADGVITKLGTGNGIIAYNASSQRPQIGIWEASSSTIDARDETTLTIVARTADAPGTYVNPTVGSVTDRQAIFEAVTVGGNTGTTEPDWTASVGANVKDGSIVWKRVDVSLQRGGYQGVVVAANLSTNDQEWYYEAKQANWSVDHQDTAGWTDGIDPSA
ncbi:hypothetical protein LCGC14_0756640 [marine sediment metagenome]|uniref:Uncharacterized protein n=1 Tax=marine sediment metagenome TaxID=412755 RepID=A0A0F9T9D1_9ZZZZ